MKIYLDNSVYNRPFDDQGQLRIQLESMAFLVIMKQIEDNRYILVNSSVTSFENDKNPFPERRERIKSFLQLAKVSVRLDEGIRSRSLELQSLGFKAIDALHLAAAEKSKAKYILSCDDKVSKRAKKISTKLNISVLNPLEFLVVEVWK